MFLYNTRFKDFKTLKEVDLEFGKINLYEGEIGQGKSSIFDGLVYVMTNFLENKIEEYIRWGEKKFEINSNFFHKNTTFDMQITGSKATKKILTINGSEEYLNSDATKYLQEIINPDIALYSAVSLQGYSTNLLFDKPTARLNKYKTIFGFDRLDEIAETIKEDIDVLKDEIKILEAEIRTLNSMTFNIEEEPDLPFSDETYKEMCEENERLKDIYKKYQDKKIEYELYVQRKEQYENAVGKIKEKRERLNELREEIAGLERNKKQPILFDSSTLNSLEKNLEYYNDRLNEIKNNNEHYKTKQNNLKELQEEKDKLVEKDSSLRLGRIKRLDFDESCIERLVQDVADLKSEIQRKEEELRWAEDGKCPTCEQDYEADVESIEKYLEDSAEKLYSFQKEIDEKRDILKNYKEKKQENENISFQKEQLAKSISTIDKKIGVIQNLLSESKYIDTIEIEDKISILKKDIDKEKKLAKEFADIEKFNNDMSNMILIKENDVKHIQEEIKSLEEIEKPVEVTLDVVYDEENHEEIKRNIEEYDRVFYKKSVIQEKNEEIRKEKSKNNKRIQEKEKEMYGKNDDINVKQETRKIILKDFSSYLINKGTEFLKFKMNEFFGKVYSTYTIDYENNDSKGLSFYYTPDNINFSEVNMASGGEKDLISLANRIALCSLQDLGILFIDEIDKFIDTETSFKLFETLFAEPSFEQFHIVSHNDSIKEWISQLPGSKIFSLSNGEII